MDISMPAISHSTSEALWTASGTDAPRDRRFSLNDQYNTTPTKQSTKPHSERSLSAKAPGFDIRRRLSKSHGDLSNLRPKSPPIRHALAAATFQTAKTLPGINPEDRQSYFTPSNDRQSQQAMAGDVYGRQLYSDRLKADMERTYATMEAAAGVPSYESSYSSTNVYPPPLGPVLPIQGLDAGIFHPLDFCIPLVRCHTKNVHRYDKSRHKYTTSDLVLEHIDISTTWNGLRYAEAEELFRIHRAFTKTLQQMLVFELRRIHVQSLALAGYGSTKNSNHPLFTTGIVRGISFCRDQLISELADALYSSEVDIAKAEPGLLRLYLAANDCLVQHHGDPSRDTSITVRMYCDEASAVPTPIVEAVWAPDSLIFKDLNDTPCEGEEFSIIPQYHSNSAFGAALVLKNVSYIISSTRHPLSWLTWNEQILGFQGVMPLFSETQGILGRSGNVAGVYPRVPYTNVEPLCIEVKAVLTNDNGSVVRYERVVRARLSLNIIPWYARDSNRALNNASSHPNQHQDTKTCTTSKPFYLRATSHEFMQAETRDCGPFFKDLPTCCDCRGTDRLAQEQAGSALPASGLTINVNDLCDLAQRHAEIAAKYSDLAQRHADAGKNLKLSSFPRGFRSTQQFNPNLQAFFTKVKAFPAHRNQVPRHSRLTSKSSISSHPSGHVTRPHPSPQSPILYEKHSSQDQVLEPGINAKTSSFPQSAFRLFPSQTFDEVSQSWHRSYTPQGTLIKQNRSSATPPRTVQLGPRLSVSKKNSKRRAHSSPSDTSPVKRARDDLPDFKAEVSGAVYAEDLTRHLEIESDGHANVGLDWADIDHDREQTALTQVGFPHSLLTPDAFSLVSRATSRYSSRGSLDPSSELEIVIEDVQKRQVSLQEQAILWDMLCSLPADSAMVCQSECEVAEPNLNKHEKNEEESRREVKMVEPRLSDDEQKALDAAIERSFDDLIGALEDVFVDKQSNSGSTSGSGDDETEEPVNSWLVPHI